MKKLLLFVLFSAIAAAQQRTPVTSLQPDCMVTFNFTAISSGAQAAGTTTAGSTGTTPVIDNRTDAGCLDWLVTYSTTTGISALSLLFQTATNANGVPGTWSTYGGTLTSGINPNTAATAPWAITNATGNKYPFLRMNLTALTGTGTVSGNLYGWKRRPVYATIAPGTICTAAAPCPVDGPTAAGSPPVFPPVLMAGQDGTNLQTIRTDTAGNPRVVGPDASGAASATNPVQIAGTETGGTVRTIRTDNVGIAASVRASSDGDGIANTFGGTPINGTGGIAFTRVWPAYMNASSTWDRMRGDVLGIWAQGPTASGTAVGSTKPLYIGGQSSSNATNGLTVGLKLSAFGAVLPSSLGFVVVDGQSNTLAIKRGINEADGALSVPFERGLAFRFNGSTWDREYYCTSQVQTRLTNSTRTQLVALSGSTIIRVCHIHLSTTTAEDITISYGTGSACATSPITIDSYLSTQSFAMDFQPTAALRTAAGNALCITQSGTQNADVTVIYSQF